MKILEGTIYNRYDENGNTNPLYKFQSTVEMLTAALADPALDKEDKKRAADFLQFVADYKKSCNPEVADFLVQLCLPSDVWSEKYVIQTIKGEDGVLRKEIIYVGSPYTPPKTQSTASSVDGTEPEVEDEEL